MNDKMYPSIPQVVNGENYRFCKSGEILKHLEEEMIRYEKIRMKHSKAQSTFSNVSVATGFISVGLSASGLGTSLSGFGIVIGLPLGVLGGMFGAISTGFGFGSKKLTNKVLKHEQTVALCREKANTVRSLISKALSDNKVSEEEFEKMLGVASDYEKGKAEIRRKARAETEKKSEVNVFVEELQKLIKTAAAQER